jgi:MFS transporter, OFA family, oxalate/formate antiporter
MTGERFRNRYIFLAAAIVMQLCLGNLYSWSIFRNPLMERHGWTIAEATVPFTLSIVFFAVGMIIAGRWQDRAGPRIVGITGGALLGLGFILAGWIGTTLPGLYLTYGVLGGLGVGFAYVTPIATVVKWFPDMRGLMTGIAVLGFGTGSLIGAPMGATLIRTVGVYGTFLIFGVTFGVLVILSAAVLINPPAGWLPRGRHPGSAKAATVAGRDYAPTEMVRTLQFYLLWCIYLLGAGVGLMVISQAVPMGQELARVSSTAAAGALGTMAIFNGLGRPTFGWISDAIGRRWSLVMAFVLYIVALLLILRTAATLPMYTIGISVVGFSYGGYLSLLPALSADYFGTKNVGINYGLIFSAYGVAGAAGPLIGAWVRAVTGGWENAFWTLAVLSAIGIILSLMSKAPGEQPTN